METLKPEKQESSLPITTPKKEIRPWMEELE